MAARRPAAPLAAEVARLCGIVERQAAALARQRESNAQLRESNARLAEDMIEVRTILGEVLRRQDGGAPLNVAGLATLKQASHECRVPVETLRRWAKHGLIASQRPFGLDWLVDTASVRTHLESRRVCGNVDSSTRRKRLRSGHG